MTLEARFRITRGEFHLEVDQPFPTNGITALFGPSGCGKTTLLRAIAGLDQHPDSHLIMDGDTWQDEHVFVAPHKRSVGYVFQEPSLFSHLDVRQNLAYGLKRMTGPKQKISLDQAIAQLGIAHLLDRQTCSLSGGERQRIAIARALAASPRLLLMDEPLAALDRQSRSEILPYIAGLFPALGIPVIYVSHSSEEVARLADHMVLISQGQVTAAGTAQDLFTRLDLPLAHEDEAASIINARVTGHDSEFMLTTLEAPCGTFAVMHDRLETGARVRLRVAARDISLTLQRQVDTSILNIFAAEISDIVDEKNGQVTIRLDANGTLLLARITARSTAQLGLQPGKQVYAQAKAVAVLS